MRSLECPACGYVNQISDRTHGATTGCQRCQKRLVDPSPTSQPIKSSSQGPDRPDRYGVHRLKEPVTSNSTIFEKGWQSQRPRRSFSWRWVGAVTTLAIVATIGVLVFDIFKWKASSRWTMSEKFAFASDVYASSILGLQDFDARHLVGKPRDHAWIALESAQKSLDWDDPVLNQIMRADLFIRFDELVASHPSFSVALNLGSSGVSDDRVTISMTVDKAAQGLFSTDGEANQILVRNATLSEVEQGRSDGLTFEEGVCRIPCTPKWNREALLKLKNPIDVQLSIAVDFNDGSQHLLEHDVRVHPLREAEMVYPWGLELTAFANEDHPWIEGIIQSIRNDPRMKSGQMTLDGAGGNAEGQLQSIYLVWKHMSKHGITYSNVTGSSAKHQRVRFLHDTLIDKGANCVDGSLALASIYGSLGFKCALVLVPGHCFLAVPVGSEYKFVEATMLGRSVDSPPQSELLAPFHESLRDDPELRSFLVALAAGSDELNEAVESAEAAAKQFRTRDAAWTQLKSDGAYEALLESAAVLAGKLKLVPIGWAHETLGIKPIEVTAKFPAANLRWTLSDKFGFASDVFASSLLGLQDFDNEYLVGFGLDEAWSKLTAAHESERRPSGALHAVMEADLTAAITGLHASRPQFSVALEGGVLALNEDRVTISISVDPKYHDLLPVGSTGEFVLLGSAELVESPQETGARMTFEDGVLRVPVSLPWNMEALRKLEQPVDVHVGVQVRFQDGTGHTKQHAIKVHPPSHVELLYPWRLGFAACVDEDHPWIDDIIATISNDPKLKAAQIALTGAGGEVDDQRQSMYLVWRYLARRGVRYANLSGTNPAYQAVQLFHDAFENKTANCVDGSMLLASIYGKLGFPCSLVFMPGHCLLRVDLLDPLDRKDAVVVFLETTLIGTPVDSPPPQELLEPFHESLRQDPELRSFLMARAAGHRQTKEALEEAEAAAKEYDSSVVAWSQSQSRETLDALENAAEKVQRHLQLVDLVAAHKVFKVDSVGAPANLSKVPPP